MQTIITHTADETKAFGKTIALTAVSGQIICLHGELGAGKTTFTKGLAEGLGITNEITSPTFTLMNIYKIKNTKLKIENLVHIDTYRLIDADELVQIGAEDYVGQPGTLTIVEWPEKIASFLHNKKVVNITFHHLEKDERKITLDRE